LLNQACQKILQTRWCFFKDFCLIFDYLVFLLFLTVANSRIDHQSPWFSISLCSSFTNTRPPDSTLLGSRVSPMSTKMSGRFFRTKENIQEYVPQDDLDLFNKAIAHHLLTRGPIPMGKDLSDYDKVLPFLINLWIGDLTN